MEYFKLCHEIESRTNQLSSGFNSRPIVRASFEVLTSRAFSMMKFLNFVRFSQITAECASPWSLLVERVSLVLKSQNAGDIVIIFRSLNPFSLCGDGITNNEVSVPTAGTSISRLLVQ
jgi:hypothetical protein